MIRTILLSLLLGCLVGAEMSAPAPETPAAVETTPPPAAPVFEEITIANDLARLVVTTNCGAVKRFELIGESPVVLPPALRERSGAVNEDPASAMKVLQDFYNDSSRPRSGLHNKIDFSTDSELNLYGTFDLPWSIVERSPTAVTLELVLADRPLAVRMAYRMEEKRPSVTVTLTLRNTSNEAKRLVPRLAPLFGGITQDYPPSEQYYLCGFQFADEAIENLGLPGANKTIRVPLQDVQYVGLKSRFFAMLWQPLTAAPTAATAEGDAGGLPGGIPSTDGVLPVATIDGSALFWSVPRKDALPMVVCAVDLPPTSVAAGKETTYTWLLTATSMRKDALALLSEDERKVEYTDGYYRFFKSLAKLLTFFLDSIAIVVRNYGVALIVLTFLLKLALHRFTFKQQASMLKMSKLAPEMKLLQERYKNDRQQLGLKTMELYKKHGVNPLSGCLPMFIQLPMFMALYQVFNHSADFRGSSFLWIHDLTLEDAIWGIDHPWLHWLTINPLALIYIGVTLWMSFQYKIPEGADPQQAQIQKMMRWMPLLFGVIFYHMPAGLVLYFTVNAILSTIEIKMVKKKLGMP